MFEQALLESAKHSPGARRTCSTAASLLLQAAALATFIIVPILTTQVAPRFQRQRPIFIPSTPAPRVEPSGGQPGFASFSNAPILQQPRTIQPLDSSRPVPDTAPVSLHPSGSVGSDSRLSAVLTGSGQQIVLGEKENTKPPIISVLQAGVVISRVQPLYPHIAIVNRVQGTVRLHAVITPNGTLEELQALSGPPMLVPAAIDAVRQWRFRPYVLNGRPIEVQTEVIVNFSLN